MMLRAPQAGLALPAVVRRGLSEGLGRTPHGADGDTNELLLEHTRVDDALIGVMQKLTFEKVQLRADAILDREQLKLVFLAFMNVSHSIKYAE